MNNSTTTTKLSGLTARPTEIQNAYNAFAVAVKNHIENPNEVTSKELETAQAEVYRVEDLYREGRWLLLQFAWLQRERARQPS